MASIGNDRNDNIRRLDRYIIRKCLILQKTAVDYLVMYRKVIVFEHETADILDLLRQSFLLNDSLLDYELLWTLTNLTAILQPKEIELLFGPESGSKNQNAAQFIIQKLTSIIASSDDGQCKRLPLCCLACWAIGNILGPVSFKITVLQSNRFFT